MSTVAKKIPKDGVRMAFSAALHACGDAAFICDSIQKIQDSSEMSLFTGLVLLLTWQTISNVLIFALKAIIYWLSGATGAILGGLRDTPSCLCANLSFRLEQGCYTESFH